MIPQKVTNFFLSQDYDRFIEDIASFLGLTWEGENMSRLIAFINDLLKTNKKGDNFKESAKNWLNFLEESKLNEFLDYFEKKWRGKIDELWQEEVVTKTEEVGAKINEEETFEEKEKRYLELMKEILKAEEKDKDTQSPEKKITISWQPIKEISPPPPPSSLSEGTIIIRKKKAEEKSEEDKNLLDLSNL